MKFKKDDYLNYSLIDLSDEKGKIVRAGDKFFAYNPLSIDDKCSHHIIFVHGFNNDFFEGLETAYNYFDIFSHFRSGNENYIGIYWPGDAHFSKAVRQADKASINFASMINHIVKSTRKASKAKITIIAHSLGNRISAKGILNLKSKYNITPIKNYIQLAPAINANAYQAEFKEVPKLVKNIIVYHSAKDKVLNNLYEIWNKFRRLKSGKKYEALGTFGPYGSVPKNVIPIEANSIAKTKVSHGTYLINENLVKSVARNII